MKYMVLVSLILCSVVLGVQTIAFESNTKNNSPNSVKSYHFAKFASPKKFLISNCAGLGQYVKKGGILFEHQNDLLNVDKEFAEKAYEFNKIYLERAKKLYEKQSMSRDSYKKAFRNFKTAENELKSTLAQIEQTKFYAPFNGTVTRLMSSNGSAFNDNDVLLELTEGIVNVEVESQTALICSRWPGVLDIQVKVGDKVKKGQQLFKINTDVLEAQKKVDESILEYEKELFDMNKKLHLVRSISYLNFYKSWLEYQRALKNVKIDKIKLEQAFQYAPFNAEVVEIHRSTGSGVGEAKPVLTIKKICLTDVGETNGNKKDVL